MARDLRHVLDAILAGVVVLDREGRVEQLNAAACRILELSSEGARGMVVEGLSGADHALARLGRSVLASAASASEGDQRVTRGLAPARLVDVSASPLFASDGECDGVVLVLRDRTLQRRLERLEAERERQTAFGRIAAGLAHEVKNPLGGIRGAAELLGRRNDDPKSREFAELIVRESERIATLVDDFMVLARSEALERTATNVHEVLDRMLDLLALDPVAKGIRVERHFDPSIPPFLADGNRLTQVFLNLARNALQAMQGSAGTLAIRTRMTLDQRFDPEGGPPVRGIEIRFRDTGPGMDEDVQREATTPFFTTRAGGTGLGLAVAEYWTAQHGGTLHIESRPGEGTTVGVTLPMKVSL